MVYYVTTMIRKKTHWILQGRSYYVEFSVSTWYIFAHQIFYRSCVLRHVRLHPLQFKCSFVTMVKKLEALRLTIFHPRGSTDSELWIRVQPSDFLRLVHHCKRMKSYLTWARMMRMSGVWVEKQRSCFLKPIPFPSERKTTDVLGVCIMNLISVGFERLKYTALR